MRQGDYPWLNGGLSTWLAEVSREFLLGLGLGIKQWVGGGKFGGKDLYNHWRWETGRKGRPQQVVCWRAGEKTGVLILEELRKRWWSAIILLASLARVNINSILIRLEVNTKGRWAKKNSFWTPLSIHLSIATHIYAYMSVFLSLCPCLFSFLTMPCVCSSLEVTGRCQVLENWN